MRGMKNIFRLFFPLFVCLAGQVSGQTFTFSCICNPDMTGSDCDVCPTQGLSSRSFIGLLVYRNGVANKWIDEPYTVRVRANETIEFLEQIPNGDKITIARYQTNFVTMQGFIDSTFCQCNSGGSLSIQVDTPLVGDGTVGNPVTIGQFGADTTMVLKWNGTHWYPGNVQSHEVVSYLPGYPSDAAAIADGLREGDAYLLSCDNIYGIPSGTWKSVKLCGYDCALAVSFFSNDAEASSGSIPIGKEYALDVANSFGLLYGFIKAVTNGTLSTGTLSCTTVLPEYASDADAITGGLSVGDAYELTAGNAYGVPDGVVRYVSTSATATADAQTCCDPNDNLPFYANDTAASMSLSSGAHYYLSAANTYGLPHGTKKVLQ